MSYEILAVFALLGFFMLYCGVRLSKGNTEKDVFNWQMTTAKFAFSLITNGLFFSLGAIAVILIKALRNFS
ncbi:MAG: hypothetical protein AB7N80_02300 [Bdellovibrionales bacterium]